MNYKFQAKKNVVLKNMSLQSIAEYESPEIVPQGKRKEQYSIDFAVRKDFFKDNKGTLTLSINDVLNSNRFGAIYDTDRFYQDSYRRRNVRNFRITFSYKFGKPNFSLFRKRPGGSNDMEMDERE
jgi:hypothetical protein